MDSDLCNFILYLDRLYLDLISCTYRSKINWRYIDDLDITLKINHINEYFIIDKKITIIECIFYPTFENDDYLDH
jgi:hypothetical protein